MTTTPIDDLLNAIAQGLVFVSLIPSGYFVIDYALVRALTKVRLADGRKIHKFLPWWKSGIGVMFVMLGSSFFFTDLVIVLTLFLGSDYPGRLILRVAIYGFCTVAAIVMALVYGIEGRTKNSVLISHADKEK